MKRLRGKSLIELMVVLSASTVILTLSTGVIHRMMRIHSDSKSFFDTERSSMRLGHQFRTDVQQATVATIATGGGPEGLVVTLESPNSRVVEYFEESGIMRRIRSEKGQRISSEEFRFPSELDATIRQQNSPSLITLSLSTVSDPIRSARAYHKPVHLEVQARLGSELRLQNRQEVSE